MVSNVSQQVPKSCRTRHPAVQDPRNRHSARKIMNTPITQLPAASTDEKCATAHGYITDKERYLARLKRIEGQARGIARMVDEEQYCIDILTQVSALTAALRGVALGLLDDHMKHCVLDAAQLGDEAGLAKMQEATEAIARFVRA
jgi:DNA-binding FrmR family transcriptional regulator